MLNTESVGPRHQKQTSISAADHRIFQKRADFSDALGLIDGVELFAELPALRQAGTSLLPCRGPGRCNRRNGWYARQWPAAIPRPSLPPSREYTGYPRRNPCTRILIWDSASSMASATNLCSFALSIASSLLRLFGDSLFSSTFFTSDI